MLKPNGRLQSVAPRVVTARTCAQSAYGLPVNPYGLLLAWGIALALALVFGLYPAIRAAKLSPMAAMS